VIFSVDLVHVEWITVPNIFGFHQIPGIKLASEPMDERWVGEGTPPRDIAVAGKRGRIC